MSAEARYFRVGLFVLVGLGALSFVWGAHIQMLRDIRAVDRARAAGYLDEESAAVAIDSIEYQDAKYPHEP